MKDKVITREEARELIVNELKRRRDEQYRLALSRRGLTAKEREVLGLGNNDDVLDFVILDRETIECVFGWIFFWHAINGESPQRQSVPMAGGGPFTVGRTGRVLELYSAQSFDEQIENFKRCGDPF